MTNKIVEYAIYEKLKALASGAVYALKAPKGSSGPFIIFQRVDSDRWRSINGPSRVARAVIQIDAYHQSIYGAKTLGAQIEEILDGFAGIVPYGANSPQDTIEIASIVLEQDSDMEDETDEPFLYRNSLVFGVTYFQ